MTLNFNNLDVIIIVIYLLFTIHGFNKGFFSSLLSLIIIGCSLFSAVKLSFFLEKFSIPFIREGNPVVTTVALFLILLFLGFYLKNFIIKPLENIKLFSILDKLLGTIVGFFKATLIVFGICYILMFFADTTFVKESKLFPYIEKYSSYIIKNVE